MVSSVLRRGDVYWVDLGPATSSAPALRRPVVVVQANEFNRSQLGTVIVAALSSNTGLAAFPGNVFVPASASGLAKDSVVNVTALVTIGKEAMTQKVGELPGYLLDELDRGLRTALSL